MKTTIKLLIIYFVINNLNITYAEKKQNLREQHISMLAQNKELQCIPDISGRQGTALGFHCASTFKNTKIETYVKFYQIDTYERLYSSQKGTREAVEAIYGGVNFDSLDSSDVNALRELINQKKVIVKIISIPDAHNKAVAKVVGTVYLDELDVGMELIKMGFAWASPPGQKANEQYNKTQKYAEENKTGFWKYGNTISPWELRELLKETDKRIKEEKIKSEKVIINVILFSLFIGFFAGFWLVIKIMNRLGSGSIFLLLIPYLALGGNVFIISLAIFDPIFMWAVWGAMITIPIAIASFIIGLIILAISNKSFNHQ